MSSFTPTQGRYLSFILAYTEGFGEPPAESEIAEALKVSAPSAHQMVKTLEKKNLIQRQPGMARSIEILVDPSEIPQWKGKQITRIERGWFPVRSRAKKRSLAARVEAGETVYQFRVTLNGTKPPIWRRIETLNMSLANLHQTIQTAMGWTNSHLHAFRIGDSFYTNPNGMDGLFPDPTEKSYAGLSIQGLVKEYGPKLRMTYIYDYGDDWQHEVLLEKTSIRRNGVTYPCCTAGARCCPPEDVGGIYGFAHFLQAIQDPEHDEHEDMLDWAGEFDAKAFDLDAINAALQYQLSKV